MGSIWQLQPHTLVSISDGARRAARAREDQRQGQAEPASTGSTVMCISAPSALHICAQQASGHLGRCHLDHVNMSNVPSKGKQMLYFQTTAKLLRQAMHMEVVSDGLVMAVLALSAVKGGLKRGGLD